MNTSNSKVYGIRWHISDENENCIKHFEKIFIQGMTVENIGEIKKDYDKLNEKELLTAKFSYYTSYYSVNSLGNYMSRFISNKNIITKFLNGELIIL